MVQCLLICTSQLWVLLLFPHIHTPSFFRPQSFKNAKLILPGSPTHVRCWIQGVQTRWVFRRLQSSVGPYFSAVITDVNHEQSWMIIDEESRFAAWLQIGHQFLPIGSCQRTLRLLWMQWQSQMGRNRLEMRNESWVKRKHAKICIH